MSPKIILARGERAEEDSVNIHFISCAPDERLSVACVHSGIGETGRASSIRRWPRERCREGRSTPVSLVKPAVIASQFASRLAQLKLIPTHAGVFRIVAATPAITQQAQATALGTLPCRLVAIVDELERKGLLERRPHESDRRSYALHLTEEGKATPCSAIGPESRSSLLQCGKGAGLVCKSCLDREPRLARSSLLACEVFCILRVTAAFVLRVLWIRTQRAAAARKGFPCCDDRLRRDPFLDPIDDCA